MINSELPQILGYTKGDVPRIAEAVSRADESLVTDKAAGDEGWVGGFAEMAFTVDRNKPYITTPRFVARLEAIDACSRPIALNNQFSEYLEFGNGRMGEQDRWRRNPWRFDRGGFTRNNSCTFTDISNPPQNIQIFAVNPADTVANPQTGAVPRVFLQGLDQNGVEVWTQDGNNTVQGEFVTLQSPFSMSATSFSFLTGIQKDYTQGQVQIWQSDPNWGIAEILSVLEPAETTGWYNRYYLHGLPVRCCPAFRPVKVNDQQYCGCPYERKEYVQVTALAKLDYAPVIAPTDYTLIQSKEALISECQSIRMSKMDDEASAVKAGDYHKRAISILIGQCVHRYGKNTPAVNRALFGRAGWGRVRLGMT